MTLSQKICKTSADPLHKWIVAQKWSNKKIVWENNTQWCSLELNDGSHIYLDLDNLTLKASSE